MINEQAVACLQCPVARALSDEKDALAARLAEAERDRDAGWDAFYKLRKAVGEDRYPGLTNIVRATGSATGNSGSEGVT